ncbi:MAG TPA: aminoacyl-tRNA hydrolase [bacterium]|nr:aminoacyl-tRNA hydrolase [bacterium]
MSPHSVPQADIRLIVGLGNPGAQYEDTRHNAGFWFVDEVARLTGATLRPEPRFHGLAARVMLEGHELWLLKPTTFMNRSGQSVAALARFYKIAPEQILIVHDEIDLPVGQVKLKYAGGHGGHNGLRDLHAHFGTPNYWRLRIGVDHPGSKDLVVDYVLHAPSKVDREKINGVIDEASRQLPDLLRGEAARVMNHLHSLK